MASQNDSVHQLQQVLEMGDRLLGMVETTPPEESLELAIQRDKRLRALPFNQFREGLSDRQRLLLQRLREQDAAIREKALHTRCKAFGHVQEVQQSRQGIKAYQNISKR